MLHENFHGQIFLIHVFLEGLVHETSVSDIVLLQEILFERIIFDLVTSLSKPYEQLHTMLQLDIELSLRLLELEIQQFDQVHCLILQLENIIVQFDTFL